MSSAEKCMDCQSGYNILFRRKLACAKCKSQVCSNCRTDLKLCHRCDLLRDERVIRLTLQELQGLSVRDLRAVQEKLGVKLGSSIVEKDDVAKHVYQRILQHRQQYERANEERKHQQREQARQQRSQEEEERRQRQQQQQQQSSQQNRTGNSAGPEWFNNLFDNVFGENSNFSNSSASGRNFPQQQQQQQQRPSSPAAPNSSQNTTNSPRSPSSSGMNNERLADDRRQREEEQNRRRAEHARQEEDKNIVVKLENLGTEQEVMALTVRQLKVLLHKHKVDFSGCVERDELLERALRLWRDYNATRRSTSALDEDEDDRDLCKICFDAPVNCVFLECGHLVTCIECGGILKECPICRLYITRRIHTFKA